MREFAFIPRSLNPHVLSHIFESFFSLRTMWIVKAIFDELSGIQHGVETDRFSESVLNKMGIWLLNNKFHGLFPSGGHHSLLFDQGFKKMAAWD